MRLRLPLLAALAALVAASAVAAGTVSAAPPPTSQSLSVPISSSQSGGLLSGVFTVTGFAVNSAGQLVATGTYSGSALVGGVMQTVTNTPATSPVDSASASGGCTILDLTLGPLHLDLLGLVVDLNQVHLTITAQPGPGNLLGNLLCSVAHLLDSSGSNPNVLQQIANLLNQILGGL